MENKKEELLVYYLDVHLGSEGQICEFDVQMNAMSLEHVWFKGMLSKLIRLHRSPVL